VKVERDQGTPQGGPLSPLLANVLLDDVDKALEARGYSFARYADDANVYVGSTKAGERVMAWLRKLYDKLKLQINEAKSAVCSVFGRKFLGYTLWVAKGREVKCKVAHKALNNFKARIRQLTGRSGRRSMAQVVQGLRPYLLGCKAYFGMAQTPQVCASWTSGCVTGCEPSNSNSGSAARRCTANCCRWVPELMLPTVWRRTTAAGGAIAPRDSTACSPLLGSTDWGCPDSPDLKPSNRLVRTRMPGGVAGAPPYGGPLCRLPRRGLEGQSPRTEDRPCGLSDASVKASRLWRVAACRGRRR